MPDPRPRIALVDDNESVLTGLRRMLEPDYDVVGCFTSSVSFLEAAPRLLPDAVVLDLFMPGMNGLETCQRLTELVPNTGVIMLTASYDEAIEIEALSAGALAFVRKYAITTDLVPAIRGVCQRQTQS